MQADDPDSGPKVPPSQPLTAPDECPEQLTTHRREVIDNLPYLVMILTGTAIFALAVEAGAWRWLAAGLYLVYGVGGALWIIVFVCPYCQFYDTRLCPCGYGQIAAKLRARKDGDRFAKQFRKHIPVIVPLWFVPLLAGGIPLFRDFSWVLLVLMLVFVANSFVILPLVSKKYGCARCSQKETCPWMGTCRTEMT